MSTGCTRRLRSRFEYVPWFGLGLGLRCCTALLSAVAEAAHQLDLPYRAVAGNSRLVIAASLLPANNMGFLWDILFCKFFHTCYKNTIVQDSTSEFSRATHLGTVPHSRPLAPPATT